MPYNNLNEFINEINHPLNVSEDARELLKLLARIVHEILTEIKPKLEKVDSGIIFKIDWYANTLVNFFARSPEPKEKQI